MMPSYTRKEHYRNYALYYKAENVLLGFDCTAHLEAKDDELFWSKFFAQTVPSKKIRFLYSSKTD